MVSIDDNSALLLYRVGPVLCCAPCLPVSSIITPPALTHPPGSHRGRPGIFKHANAIVSVLDLRFQFGVEEADWTRPGRIIITALNRHHIGFHVDAILDVIKLPTSGWGGLPVLLPRGVFSRTLLLKEQIYLYAEFDNLQGIPHSGYLRQYIQQLLAVTTDRQDTSAPPLTAVKTAVDSSAVQARSDPNPNEPAAAVADRVDTTRDTHTAIPHKAAPAPPPGKVRDSSATRRPGAGLSPTSNSRQPPAVPPRLATTANTKPAQRAPRTAPASVVASRPSVSAAAQTHASPVTTPVSARPGITPNTAFSPRSTLAPVPVQARIRHDRGRLVAGLLLLLLAGIFGSGLWYVLSIETAADKTTTPQTPAGPDLDAATQNSIAPPEPSVETVTPMPTTPGHTQVQQVTPAPLPDNMTVHTDTAKASPAGKAKTAAAPASTSGQQVTDSHGYHARIEKDPHGLTITVDVPASDPAFAQTPNTTPATASMSAPPTANHTLATADKDTAVPTMANPATADGAHTPAPAKRMVVITHVVVRGDTLWAIAKRYVQDPFRYPELARLSKIKNPDLIYPGDRVRIIKRIRQDN